MKKLVTLLIATAISQNAHCMTTRDFGDLFQIASPLFTSIISLGNKDFLNFACNYGQGMAFVGAGHGLGQATHPPGSKRPHGRYNGFPSGHTMSAWLPAAYIREHGGRASFLAFPLYIGAFVTGVSRIQCEAHTPLQVVGAIVLAESVVYANKNINWGDLFMDFDKSSFNIRINFKF